MYVSLYLYIHECVFVPVRNCMQAHVCECTGLYVCVHVCVSIHVCLYFMHVNVCMCLYPYVCKRVYLN